MRNISLIVFISIFCSFSSKDIEPSYVIDLLSSPKSELKNLSEIATDVLYLPLQTTENSLISRIISIKSMNDKFYLLQPWQILCFDKTGKFLYKLDKQGTGPEEYTIIKDFDISPVSNMIAILDSKKILVYRDTGNGIEFTKSVKLSDSPSKVNFIPGLNNMLISFPTPTGNELIQNIIISPDGKSLLERPNNYKYKRVSGGIAMNDYVNLQFASDDKLYFKYWICDTIFAVDQSKNIKPYLILDTQGKHITTEFLADFKTQEFYKYMVVNLIMEVPRYILYRYAYNKERYFEIYDKVTKTKLSRITIVSNQAKWLTDDINGGVDFEPKACINGAIYSWVDAISLKNYAASETAINLVVKHPDKKKLIQQIANSLTETDNPVLIIANPKK